MYYSHKHTKSQALFITLHTLFKETEAIEKLIRNLNETGRHVNKSDLYGKIVDSPSTETEPYPQFN